MAKERQCILCETVHASKREMDEHMRSMLHHRELEKLKGRDCGHECRVCKVTVVSLTDYAGHISSPTHKQNVEAAEKRHAGDGHDEEYFDQALVQLVEKRKEKIRKEKEEAAAKLAKEEEERRKVEVIQQRIKEAKERSMERSWQQRPQGFKSHHRTWYRCNQFSSGSGDEQPWNQSKQGKSATWHAQEPPNFQRWASEQLTGERWSGPNRYDGRQVNQGAFQHNRLPWLSNGGSSNGIYGCNNISQYQPRVRPQSLFDVPLYPPPPFLYAQTSSPVQRTGSAQEGKNVVQNGEGQNAEPDYKAAKTFGSNPKLDKSSRWSPYPISKGSESLPHKDTNSSEKHPKVQKPQTQDTTPENSAFTRQSRPEKKPGQSSLSPEERGKLKTNPQTKPRDGSSSSSSRSSSTQREDKRDSVTAASNQSVKKPAQLKDKKVSSMLGLNFASKFGKQSSQKQSQSTTSESRPSAQMQFVGTVQSRKERQLPATFNKAKQAVLERRASLDSSKSNRMEMGVHSTEEQHRDHGQSHIEVNKENSCRQKQNLPECLRPEKPAVQTSDSSQFLQSLQVSTSTSDKPESCRKNEENRKKEECKEESMQAEVAGHSSESDNSRNGEAHQTVSGSNLSQLDLPPVLKRDLTKHISSKSKPGNLEPNLNIARRVRNLSESRRSDTEKDSGLKPTVRQLISSSGSRRNVNWEQVYQEVRKKQDKGKGMPRFGIEMVPCEQEDQSQEEDNIPLLEGFQWDSLMDVSSTGSSRKRSLSESSVAPTSIHSLFASHSPQEAHKEGAIVIKQESSVSPRHQSDEGDKSSPRQHEFEHMLGQFGAQAQKQPEKLTSMSVKSLQRSDSVLGDSSSGTEQVDGQGTGKRRRAAGDVTSPETSCLEHNSKRRKVKSKRERLQIDQLLAVSLREEELSKSIQTVDSSLIQARAALQAAYMEVQRLMVVKQQMAGEMNTLRNRRIELLKGMQGNMDEAPAVKLKEEKIDPEEMEPRVPSCLSLPSLSDPGVPSPGPPAERASPLSSSLPFNPAIVKQEPQSPVHVSLDPDPVENITHCAHSTTPELPPPPTAAASPSDPALNFQSSPERNPEPYQNSSENNFENFEEHEDSKQSISGQTESVERASQTARVFLAPQCDSKSSIKLLSPSRRGSEVGSAADSAVPPTSEPPSALTLPNSPSELRSGKRVRKLKKRKVLKKAQGVEQPESSDTELDGEALRPRWLRPRRRPSGGSQVSTSTLPLEDRDVSMEAAEELSQQSKEDSKSPSHTLEPPPAELRLNSDQEESMEVNTDCQQVLEDQTTTSHYISSTVQQHSLACNEVSSTSDMDVCRSSESDLPIPVPSAKAVKTSSDVSSDHGEDDLPTEGVFEGHQEAVNAMQIHNGLLYTCSGDRTVRVFDLVSHKCVGVFEGHSSKVSCLLVSAAPSLHQRLYTGSSDQTIRCYSLKTHELETQFSLSDRVLCLHSRWKLLYAGLANGTVVTFNLKTNKQSDVFECHGPRAVSCLASSQEGARRILLVGSYDSTISVRDAKNGLLLRTLEGHTKTVLCMKVVNDLVFSGSSDQCVYAHNMHSGELIRVYKGHSHAVTVVSVLGKVMVTACLDKLVRVYDLQSHDQLQVYGGHKDMVMCMAVHKNMIYTGCYDGSVQAVKLNLMQNYRCRWHGCPLVFGMMDHLQQHLVNDHTSTNVQTLRCRWKNCEEFLCTRSSSKQAMLLHMQKHAEEETEVEP